MSFAPKIRGQVQFFLWAAVAGLAQKLSGTTLNTKQILRKLNSLCSQINLRRII